MNDNFKKQISEITDLNEIAEIISLSTELRESVSEYIQNPYNPLFITNKHKTPVNFSKKGDTIYLLGDYTGNEEDNSSTMEVILDAIDNDLIRSINSIGKGGLFVSLIESCSVKKLGFDITSDSELCEKDFLFSDNNNSVLVSVSSEKEGKFVDFFYNNGVKITLLGHVTKGELRMDDISFGYISEFNS